MTTTQDKARAVTLLERAERFEMYATELETMGLPKSSRMYRAHAELLAREAKELKAGVS